MKYNIVVFLVFEAALRSFGQTPSNDSNWTKTWGDEFNTPGKPNPSVWNKSNPWGPNYNSFVAETADGYNTNVNDSFLSLTTKVGSHGQVFDSIHTWSITGYDPYTHIIDAHDTDSTVHYIIRTPFTKGAISTGRSFTHGYIEARMRMPDTYYPLKYGNMNNAFWLYNNIPDSNIAHSELDFEIVSNDSYSYHLQTNEITTDIQMEKPNGIDYLYDHLTGPKPPSDPAHFLSYDVEVDTNTIKYKYFNRYENKSLVFDHGWHIFGYEWLPDQIKMYIDNKLWFRLEGNFAFNYTDIYGIPKTIYPVHDLNAAMPLFFDIGIGTNGGDTTAAGPDSLSLDVDYVRYYELKQNSCGITDSFIVTGTPIAYEMVGNYVQKYHDKVILGSAGSGCNSYTPPYCGVTVTNGRVSVRSQKILLLDGFRTGENGEFYADDVDYNICKH